MKSMRSTKSAGWKLALSGLLLFGGLGAVLGPDAAAAASGAPSAESKYIGATKCKSCHSSAETGDQYGAWQKAKHSHAFEVLGTDEAKAVAKAKDIADPQKADECLKCHLTGHGKSPDQLKGKWDEKMNQLGVQCESCHGPGEAHMKARLSAAAKADPNAKPEYNGVPADELVAVPGPQLCKGCHNAESPSYKPFCYHKATAQVRHLNPLRKYDASKLGCDDPCRCEGDCSHTCDG